MHWESPTEWWKSLCTKHSRKQTTKQNNQRFEQINCSSSLTNNKPNIFDFFQVSFFLFLFVYLLGCLFVFVCCLLCFVFVFVCLFCFCFLVGRGVPLHKTIIGKHEKLLSTLLKGVMASLLRIYKIKSKAKFQFCRPK